MAALKPVLLGMNSPQSDDPSMALYPWNGGSAGGRLVSMIQDAAEHPSNGGGFFFPPEEYLRIFDRRNVLNEKVWDPRAASERAQQVKEDLRGRLVVICGVQVLKVLSLSRREWMVWSPEPRGLFPYEGINFRYCVIPHPSGLSRDYNNPEKRLRVGQFLLRLAADYLSAEGGGA